MCLYLFLPTSPPWLPCQMLDLCLFVDLFVFFHMTSFDRHSHVFVFVIVFGVYLYLYIWCIKSIRPQWPGILLHTIVSLDRRGIELLTVGFSYAMPRLLRLAWEEENQFWCDHWSASEDGLPMAWPLSLTESKYRAAFGYCCNAIKPVNTTFAHPLACPGSGRQGDFFGHGTAAL